MFLTERASYLQCIISIQFYTMQQKQNWFGLEWTNIQNKKEQKQ